MPNLAPHRRLHLLHAASTLFLPALLAIGVACANAAPSSSTLKASDSGRPNAAMPAASLRVVPFGDIVPAYGVNNVTRNYFSLNAASPATLTTLGTPGTSPASMWGAGFLHEDFSKEYLLGDSGFYSIDTATGVPTTISASAGGGDVWAMTADPVSNVLYWIGPTTGQTLSTIDELTGATTTVAALSGLSPADGITGIAVDSSGQMFGIDRNNDVLVKIDKATAAVTTVGALGIDTSNVVGLAFDQLTGILYFADQPSHSMYTIDTGTGAATLIGQIGDGTTALKALAIARAGVSDVIFADGFEDPSGRR